MAITIERKNVGEFSINGLTVVKYDSVLTGLQISESSAVPTRHTRIRINSSSNVTNGGTGIHTVTGLQRPAGAFILGVSLRILSTLSGAGLTTFGLGDGSDTDRYGAAIGLAGGTIVDMNDATANPTEFLTVAGDIVLTADAGQFDSGQILVAVHYIDLTQTT